LHPLEGKRKGEYVLDIGGRVLGYRLIHIPLNEKYEAWDISDNEVVYKNTKAIEIMEISKHYE
jgi:hypothetical protein